jgi:hypothetical protein
MSKKNPDLFERGDAARLAREEATSARQQAENSRSQNSNGTGLFGRGNAKQPRWVEGGRLPAKNKD